MKEKKEFWSLISVVFLAIVMPTILRQVNKISRIMAGAEGRLAAINVNTSITMGKTDDPFLSQTSSEELKEIAPDELRMYLGTTGNRLVGIAKNRPASYYAAMGSELLNLGMKGQYSDKFAVKNIFEKLGRERLALTGEGSWVFATATKDNNVYQVILANFDSKGTHSEVVPVNFLGLLGKKFEFRKTYLGSPTTSEIVSTDSGMVQKMIPMMANTVAFLELETK